MRTVRLLAAATASVMAMLVGLPAMAATAPPDDGTTTEEPAADPTDPGLASFGIAPAGVDRPDDRPFLAVTAPPGAVIYEHAAFINQGAAPIDLGVYSGDVIMAEDGLSVSSHADAPTDAGAWIDFGGLETVSVPAQTPEDGYGYVIVPFTVTIPADAEPGDHVAGIVASLLTSGQGGENSPNIELEQRVAARVYITVDGEKKPGLAVSIVKATFEPGGMVAAGSTEVTYTVTNTGNVRMAVEPSVEVAGPFGLLARSASADRVDELLPGGTVTLTTVVPDVWPLVREDVTVSATGVASAGGGDPGVGTVTATSQVWAIPWALIALLVLLIALVLLYVRWHRRRARRSSGRRVAPRSGRRRAARAEVRAPSPAPADEAVPAGAGPAR